MFEQRHGEANMLNRSAGLVCVCVDGNSPVLPRALPSSLRCTNLVLALITKRFGNKGLVRREADDDDALKGLNTWSYG